jgi:hypothetical protein
MHIHLPANHVTLHLHFTTVHVTSAVIAICAALCAERALVAYPTWKLAKRRGRMWPPYVLFGLLGLAFLALRSPAYSVLSARQHPKKRTGYTHAGFSGPVPEAQAEVDLYQAKRKRRRLSPLHGYHLPYGGVDETAR